MCMDISISAHSLSWTLMTKWQKFVDISHKNSAHKVKEETDQLPFGDLTLKLQSHAKSTYTGEGGWSSLCSVVTVLI